MKNVKNLRIRFRHDMTERARQQLIADMYPLQHLYVEKAIEPHKSGWQTSYYKTCFNMDNNEENLEYDLHKLI